MSGGGGGGAGLMSCVREGSLEPPYRPPHHHTHTNGEGRTGRFLRGLRRMFKRRGSGARASSPDPKSSSTSELLDAERHKRRKDGAYGSGLSVSHDSVFTGERSGDESPDERHHLPLLSHTHRAELVAAVRRRGRGDVSDDDEDLGLPRSPPASPPTDKADKRHHAGISQSSCSDGSLLSVGSSEIEEDSSSGHHHSHEHSRSDHSDLYSSSEPPSGLAPLSHSAAKHKMAVRPRRTHGAPRRKKNNPIAASALPITPELNEEVVRSTTPDVTHKTSEVVTESYSSSITTKHAMKEHQMNREVQRAMDTADAKLKSCSLPARLPPPPGAAPPTARPPPARSPTPSPRASIRRSKSTSQDQHPHLNAPEPTEKHKKHAEQSCPEKKSKRMENEAIKSSKKEESFFSRLLLRKSGKKPKKEQMEVDHPQEVKRSKADKVTALYKAVDTERNYGEGVKPVPAERTHRSAGQKAFANQMHKRVDQRGGYTRDTAYKDVYSAAKVPGLEYSITDLKVADETDKMLNQEMKNRFSRREEFIEKSERSKRAISREDVNENKRESFSLHHDKSKRPVSVQRLIDPLASKTFINNEIATRAREELMPASEISDEEPPIRAIRNKTLHGDFMFHSGNISKSIPYFDPGIKVSASISPPKPLRHQSSENVRNRSSERASDITEKMIENKRTSKTDEPYFNSGMRSIGDEFVESRNSIAKSHSFRYASETTSICSQENQMPSLPAIVGISEPLLESWEVNYRRNVGDRHDFSKRVSARNYSIMHGTPEATYDSLPSTDSSYLDSLKNDIIDDRKLLTNSIHITIDSHKRDSDISQIEAKIDDIISSPKPIISSILKSSSLDSVKSSTEKPVDDRRKTISVESSLSHAVKANNVHKETKHDIENFVSVTHINKEQTPTPIKTIETSKINKSEEKINKINTKPGVPEFLNIQLNKVDAKPATNIVLTANVTPKKFDSPQTEKVQEIDIVQITELKSSSIRKESITSKADIVLESVQNEEKISPSPSPVFGRKSAASVAPLTPQTPSTPKNFFKRKATSVELQERPEKPRTNSMSTDGSSERIFDNISMDQKSHSSFGSKSSIHSSDSNEVRTPDRLEDAVIYRKKPVVLSKEFRSNERKNDDEPELMKVFARRSLKIKDTEADSLAQDIADYKESKDEINDNITANRTKILKNEFNASIKSRDSDKENEDTVSKEQVEENRVIDVAARVSQFGVPHYQRSVSINSVTNPKRDSAPVYKSEVSKYKKEVSDSTPEKRLRNRTFPDPSNDRDVKSISKSEALAYKADTLSKRPWQRDEERVRSLSEKRESAVIEKDGEKEKEEVVGEKESVKEDGCATPQFKGILQMRAEWERRARQALN